MADSLQEKIDSISSALTAPISEENPVGEDITYDDDFRALKNAVDALNTATDAVDFDWIAAKSLDVLEESSKDLRVAAYLVVGQTQAHGLPGLAASLTGVRGLIDSFWEEMHPPARRAAARKHALQFVSDYLRPWVKKQTFELPDRRAIDVARESGAAIQQVALDRLGEHAPAWSGLLHELDAAASRLEERAAREAEAETDPASSDQDEPVDDAQNAQTESARAPAEEPTPRPGDGSPDASVPVEPQPTVAIRESGGELSDTEWQRVVLQRAASVRDSDLSRVEPYRLVRLLRWGSLSTEPPSDGGTTELPAPDKDQRAALAGLADRGKHETLLEAGEQAFQAGNFWFWLDLQRLEIEAASALGGAFAGVADALRDELGTLLRRLPGLPMLSFRDGTPFANATTQGWLESLPPAAGDPGEAQDETPDALREALRRAREKLGRETLEAAIREIDTAAPDGSARSGFRRDLFTARLCMEAGRLDVARPILEDLDAQIEAYDLVRWEPTLAIQAWKRLYTCYVRLHRSGDTKRAGDGDRTYREAARATYDQLCRVDATAVLSLPDRPD